jgi:hypothetical protein
MDNGWHITHFTYRLLNSKQTDHVQQIVMKRLLRGQMFRNSKDGRMGRKDDFFRLGMLSDYINNFHRAVDCRKIPVGGKIREPMKVFSKE